MFEVFQNVGAVPKIHVFAFITDNSKLNKALQMKNKESELSKFIFEFQFKHFSVFQFFAQFSK
jgi:hypothetical protein